MEFFCKNIISCLAKKNVHVGRHVVGVVVVDGDGVCDVSGVVPRC